MVRLWTEPTRSRSPDELLTGTGLPEDADSDYFRLIDFLAWSDRAARLRRQRAVDQNDRERPLMARGAVARIALDARRDADRSVAADPQAVIMVTLLDAGVPLAEGVPLAADACGDRTLEQGARA